MTPRPFHRWKTFCFGLLFLIFLGGSWTRSMLYHDALAMGFGHHAVSLGQSPEGILLGVVEYPTAPTREFISIARSIPLPPDRSQIWFPPAVTWSIDGVPHLIEARGVHIAHWLLILLFAPAWAIRLLRQSRRMKRPEINLAR